MYLQIAGRQRTAAKPAMHAQTAFRGQQGFGVPCWHEIVAEHGRNVVIVAVGLAQIGVEGPLAELHSISETVRCQYYDQYQRAKQAIESALAQSTSC